MKPYRYINYVFFLPVSTHCMSDKVIMLVPKGISQSNAPSHPCVKCPHKMLNCLFFQLLHPVLTIRRSHQHEPRGNFQVSFHNSCILRLSTHCEDCCRLTSRSCMLVLRKMRRTSLSLIHSVQTGSVHHIQIRGEFVLLHTSHSTGAYCSYVPGPAVFPIFRVQRNYSLLLALKI